MTISSTDFFNPYTADGTETTFPFTFSIALETELKVIVTDTNSNELIKTLNSDYTVTLNSSGLGNVVFNTAPTANYAILIKRNVSYTQDIDLQNSASGVTSLENTEKGLDKLTRIVQDLALANSKSIKTAEGSTVTDLILPTGSAYADKYLKWNSVGTNIQGTDIINTTAITSLAGDIQKSLYTYFVSAGSSNAYIITPNPALEAYTAGVRLQFKANHANTGAVTLNANGLGARAVKDVNGAEFISGAIPNNAILDIQDNGTEFRVLSKTYIAPFELPPGLIFPYPSSIAPSGFFSSNGAAVSRTTYAPLFGVLGTTWGVGDGSTTFNIPDLRGEFVRGWDNGRGIDSGRAFASSQADELKSHSHTIKGSAGGSETGGYNPALGACSANSFAGDYSGGIGDTGGSETRPRNIALMYIIKY